MWLAEIRTPLNWGRLICVWGFIIAAPAFAQTAPLDTLVRQHERAVQDATRRDVREVDSLSPDNDSAKTAQRLRAFQMGG